MPPSGNDDQRIIDEYSALLDRSQQLFSGLRDVPQFGKQWQPYFQRTFEVYTKLWKFQQIHRGVLEGNKDRERLTFKRHDIGEIASKIGQLYYHYYLRTSEPNYLHESCVFYEAIRSRGYFKDVLDAKNAVPMVKKLRYYARFIVVCLLLNKRQLVESLVAELTQDVESYIKTFKPNDNQEWQFVLQEIAQFLEADNILFVDDSPAPVSRRLSYQMPSDQSSRIKVQEAILVGNYQHQVKFSELTLDMFRIMQCLEWEPEGNSDTSSERKDQPGEDRGKGKRNPHKYLMYRPTMSQLLVFLANSFKELQDNNVLLLYISADGIKQSPVETNTNSELCTSGGVVLNSRRSPEKQQTGFTPDCFYPEDLLVYTRKHLFLIIDSDNSEAFEKIPSVFGKHVVCLMSPKAQPTEANDPENSTTESSKIGNLFTLFLCDPISAFCYVMGKTNISAETHTKVVEKNNEFQNSILQILQSQPSIDPAFLLFSQEDFLRRFILNYIFCMATMLYHKKFQHSQRIYWPKIHPTLPNELFHHRTLQCGIYDLANILNTSELLVGELDIQPEPQIVVSVEELSAPAETNLSSS